MRMSFWVGTAMFVAGCGAQSATSGVPPTQGLAPVASDAPAAPPKLPAPTSPSEAIGSDGASADPEGGFTPPVPRQRVIPRYPEAMRSARVETEVTARFTVTERGDVTDVRILSGRPEFHADVVEALEHWTFEPATANGKPVAVVKTVRFPFRLRAR